MQKEWMEIIVGVSVGVQGGGGGVGESDTGDLLGWGKEME